MKLTMLVGLPASGKTTFAREEVKKNGSQARINRDDLRAMLFNSEWTDKREGVVIDCEKAIAEVLLRHNMNPVVDDTNLSAKHRDLWSGFAKTHETHFEVHKMDASAAKCRMADLGRERSVGRAVIDRMALQNGLVDWGVHPIALFDIDGTLSDGEHRVHHVKGEKKDWKTYFSLLSEDTPIESTVAALNQYRPTHTICLVSGRPDTYQRETMAWLAKHGIVYDWLFMRAGSDKRPDTMVKEDFLKHMPKERIKIVYDDRPSVCRMWESHGLNVEWVRGRDCEEF